MMSEVKLRVDAATGVLVSESEKVEKGQRIGQETGNTGQSYLCPGDGVVKQIVFDGDNHEFVVLVEIRGDKAKSIPNIGGCNGA